MKPSDPIAGNTRSLETADAKRKPTVSDSEQGPGILDTAYRYRPDVFTRDAPHVRDAASLAGLLELHVLALCPVLLIALYNTGYQAAVAMTRLDIEAAPGWRGAFLSALGLDGAPSGIVACLLLGASYFGPVCAVSVLVGEAWQRLFAAARGRTPDGGVLLITLLFALSLPATIPLWQVAVGISFGIVFGREIFGGIGKNFLHPALVGIAFLYFAYPASLRGSAWVPVDGWSGATALETVARGGMAALEESAVSWLDCFLGIEPGTFGETSTLACMLGAAFLLSRRVISWRILAGALLGLVATAASFAAIASETLPMADLPWYWHASLGSLAFGLVFFATDPSSAAITDPGRWCYGALIGGMTVVIRVANDAHTEGALLAILLGNAFAPLIDHFVIRANVRRRRRRHG